MRLRMFVSALSLAPFRDLRDPKVPDLNDQKVCRAGRAIYCADPNGEMCGSCMQGVRLPKQFLTVSNVGHLF